MENIRMSFIIAIAVCDLNGLAKDIYLSKISLKRSVTTYRCIIFDIPFFLNIHSTVGAQLRCLALKLVEQLLITNIFFISSLQFHIRQFILLIFFKPFERIRCYLPHVIFLHQLVMFVNELV
jgi:hypothetical protein